jgi:hypothetical protein
MRPVLSEAFRHIYARNRPASACSLRNAPALLSLPGQRPANDGWFLRNDG